MPYQTRVMQDADLPVADRLMRLAYRNEQSFLPRLRRHLELQPDGWMVVESDGAIVGCGGSTIMGSVAYIGLIAVDPTRQRQGIGVHLMRELIAWLHSRGCATMLLDASDAGKPLYLQLGFEIEDHTDVWSASGEPPYPLPQPETISVQPFQEDDLSDILAFDTNGYGAPREHVVAAFLHDDPATTCVARDHAGALLGYLAVQSSTGIIGPWLAATPDAATALLSWALANQGAHTRTVFMPAANRAGEELLRSAGFTRMRTLAHMRLGAPLPLSRRQMVYGQINLALG